MRHSVSLQCRIRKHENVASYVTLRYMYAWLCVYVCTYTRVWNYTFSRYVRSCTSPSLLFLSSVAEYPAVTSFPVSFTCKFLNNWIAEIISIPVSIPVSDRLPSIYIASKIRHAIGILFFAIADRVSLYVQDVLRRMYQWYI